MNRTEYNTILKRHDSVKKLKEKFLKEDHGLIGPIRAVEIDYSNKTLFGEFPNMIYDTLYMWNQIGDYCSKPVTKLDESYLPNPSFDMQKFKEKATVIGYFAAYKNPKTGNVGTGYSYTAVEDNDSFDKDFGIQLAINRAIRNSNYKLEDQRHCIFDPILANNMAMCEVSTAPVIREFPIPLASQVDHFAKRCTNYYKTSII